MKHFFNVMYCPFLIKTYVAFPFYLSCFGLNKKRQLQQYQRKRQKQSHGSNYYLIEIQGPVTCKFSQTRIHPQCLEQWQIGFNLCTVLICAQYDLSCNARFLIFVWMAFNLDWIKMPNFFCKVNFVRNFIFISITNFMFRVTVKVEIYFWKYFYNVCCWGVGISRIL